MTKLIRSLGPAAMALVVCLLLMGCSQTQIKQAVLAGDTAAMEKILKADPSQANFKDTDGNTMLHLAVLKGDEQVVQVLLMHGAYANAKNAEGDTPLQLITGEKSIGIMRLLLRSGAKLEHPNALLARAACMGDVEVAQLLIDRGANVNGNAKTGGKDKSSPLYAAVGANMPDMVEFLISRGADVSITNDRGQTPLHMAAESLYTQIAKSLLDHGAKVDPKTVTGETPLHRAAFFGRSKMVEVLLARGASVNAKAKDERTPLDMAAVECKPETVQVLRQHGGKPSKRWELMGAVALSDKAAIGKIMAERPSAATEEINGLTPLHFAARHGLVISAQTLVAHKVNIDIRCSDGETPLHFATRLGQVKMAEFLVNHGAQINIRDKRGLTPLMYYYHAGIAYRQTKPTSPPAKRHQIIEKLLLAHGAIKE